MVGACRIGGCDRGVNIKCHKLCNMHYLRIRHTGSPFIVRKSSGNLRHGRFGTPIYNTWASMLQRCRNPRNQDFVEYGLRGITVCERWLSFKSFYEDMGDKPSPIHTLDRIDNSLGYYPENCHWATPKEQANNRRPRRYAKKVTV